MCLANEFKLQGKELVSLRSGKVVVGTVNNMGYRVVSVGKKKYLYHRVIYYLHHGHLPEILDHIDRDRLNNCISNLRAATYALNTHNVTRKSATGVQGVYLKHRYGRTRYRAKIVVDKKGIELGLYDDLESARAAYQQAAEKYYG